MSTVLRAMQCCLLSPSEPPTCASCVTARPGTWKEAPTRQEGQSCKPAAALCRAEARLRYQKPAGVRPDPLWSRAISPLDASRGHPQSLAANARHEGEPGRTHLPARMTLTCRRRRPILRSGESMLRATRAKQCDGPAGPLRHPSPQRPPIAAQQQKGTPLGSSQRSKDQAAPPRPGEPQGAASPGSPRCPVPRDARRLHGGAHPVADAHRETADGARVGTVRARCRPAGAARPETAASGRPEARVRRA